MLSEPAGHTGCLEGKTRMILQPEAIRGSARHVHIMYLSNGHTQYVPDYPF